MNIIGFNSAEWAFAFHGSILGHYLPIGMYTSNGPEACAYIANHSEAQIVIMEDESHLAKYTKVLNEVKAIKYYVYGREKFLKVYLQNSKAKCSHGHNSSSSDRKST